VTLAVAIDAEPRYRQWSIVVLMVALFARSTTIGAWLTLQMPSHEGDPRSRTRDATPSLFLTGLMGLAPFAHICGVTLGAPALPWSIQLLEAFAAERPFLVASHQTILCSGRDLDAADNEPSNDLHLWHAADRLGSGGDRRFRAQDGH
jgi:hypothetical protein